MKYLFVLLITLVSCTPQFHINKAKKHTKKAIDKGAVLKPYNDTIYINDTIVTQQTFRVNDTVYFETIKTIEKVIHQVGEIRYVTKKDKRKESRQVKVDSRRNFKLDKLDKKTEKVTARKKGKNNSYWWIWLLTGCLGGYFLKKYMPFSFKVGSNE